ncbi:MAG: glycosyltransferase, exosortase A system-associated [Thiobacillaceae bacterium]|nr:glycosyltransferase, exosortase A system-associated [Thiobacillaceae bacterium]MDW8324021.1 glycosyltransferase, exosortase A system-associated [Burkholderiales bacterium]
MSLKILHVFDHSLPLHSGYTFRSANILREQQRLGWQTWQLTSPKHKGTQALEEEAEGLRFYRTLPANGPLSRLPGVDPWLVMRATARRLEELAVRLKPDLIHAHSPVLNAYPALNVGRRLGIPVVYEIRAFWEDAAVDHGSTREGSPRYRVTKWLETRAVQRADAVVTICEGLRADLIRRGVAPEKIGVVPNAVDIHSFVPSRAPDPQLRARLGLTGCKVLGFIGSFYAYEGLDLLLAALPRLIAAEPAIRVLLVGGGPQEENLKAQARALGLADKVIFTGRVPHREVSLYYDQIDLLVYARHPMRLTELVTPLKPLEAMAQGRLFIASDVGGHRELIRDGETGLLFRAGDPGALAQRALDALHLPDGGAGLRAAGRRYVEQERNWPSSVANYRAIYGRVLGRPV